MGYKADKIIVTKGRKAEIKGRNKTKDKDKRLKPSDITYTKYKNKRKNGTKKIVRKGHKADKR